MASEPPIPSPPEQSTDWFSRLVQVTGWLMTIFVFVFWAITNRVSVPLIGLSMTLLVFDAGRSALQTLNQRGGG